MTIGILHLSDIHFRKGTNPVSARVDKIAAAVESVCPTMSGCIIVVSGDVAFSGDAEEYMRAQSFFSELKEKLNGLHAGLETNIVVVPGNHDCVLPKESTALRDALISGIMPSLETGLPDKALMSALLGAQSNYEDFRAQIAPLQLNGDMIGEIVFVNHGKHKIQLNLYNTSITSRLEEKPGALRLPVKYLGQQIPVSTDADLCISVFHHSYAWLHPDDGILFRSHVERTSDVALTGHQHNQDGFHKNNLTGERTLYVEGGALQAEEFASTSSFQLLLFTLDELVERTIQFRWSANLYKPIVDSSWVPWKSNRAIRGHFRLTAKFESFLNETGTPFTKRAKPDLRLRDIYVYPDLMVRGTGDKPTVREVRGDSIGDYVAKADRVLFQAPGLAGKTSLAKVLFSDMLNSGGYIPLLLSGRNIDVSADQKVQDLFWNAFKQQYDSSGLEEFRQLKSEKRVLLIDDWQRADLNGEGRTAFLEIASRHFGKILLFATDLFQIKELTTSSGTILKFEWASIEQFRYALRGRLIDKWLRLGRERTAQPPVINRETEETERLVSGVIGKNILPSTPFVVLCMPTPWK